jgi:hypothetical protein
MDEDTEGVVLMGGHEWTLEPRIDGCHITMLADQPVQQASVVVPWSTLKHILRVRTEMERPWSG